MVVPDTHRGIKGRARDDAGFRVDDQGARMRELEVAKRRVKAGEM
jgi:hypothetical protein